MTPTDPEPIEWEWTHKEEPCTCTPTRRRWCARCNGTGTRKIALLRRIEPKDDQTQKEQP